MKPTNRYIEWLKKHPAVWEALQEEWEPAVGDRVMWGKCLALVTFVPGADTTYLRVKILGERETSKKSEDLFWLPTLSGLLGMIEETAHPTSMGFEWDGDSWDGYFHISELGVDVYEQGDTPTIAAAELLKKVQDETPQ